MAKRLGMKAQTKVARSPGDFVDAIVCIFEELESETPGVVQLRQSLIVIITMLREGRREFMHEQLEHLRIIAPNHYRMMLDIMIGITNNAMSMVEMAKEQADEDGD